MGQYLSAPVTEKETSEGYHDSLGYGLAAMQGWRVSMEDAHITALDLDPTTSTSLFSIFDGHGGKAVAKFCSQHLAQELLSTPAYKRGDLRQALVDAYYRLDVVLDSEAGKAELRQLVGGGSKKGPPGALFSEVESGMQAEEGEGEGEGDGALDNSNADDAETAPLEPSAGGAAGSAGSASSAAGAAGGPADSPEEGKAKPKPKMNRVPSEQFVASHLQRASVITPVDAAGPAGAAGAAGDPPQQGQQGGPANGALAAGGGAKEGGGQGQSGGDDEEEEEEEEEEHHAAGMGCTAVSVLVRGDRVLVANTGDSRCVLSRRGQAVALTLDHKPILFEEARRIIKAGGFVRDNRINGALNVSRTIGDLDFKRNAQLPPSEQMVVATPDIESFSLQPGDEFIVLACDGIWDVMSNQEAVDFVRKRLKGGMSLKSICEAMCDACLAPDLKGLCRGADNMSVVLILFRKYANLGGWWNRLLASMCHFTSPSSALHRNSSRR